MFWKQILQCTGFLVDSCSQAPNAFYQIAKPLEICRVFNLLQSSQYKHCQCARLGEPAHRSGDICDGNFLCGGEYLLISGLPPTHIPPTRFIKSFTWMEKEIKLDRFPKFCKSLEKFWKTKFEHLPLNFKAENLSTGQKCSTNTQTSKPVA